MKYRLFGVKQEDSTLLELTVIPTTLHDVYNTICITEVFNRDDYSEYRIIKEVSEQQ
jgi:hypothetical protein